MSARVTGYKKHTGGREVQLVGLSVEDRGLLVDLEPGLAGTSLSRVRGGGGLGGVDRKVLQGCHQHRGRVNRRITYSWVVDGAVLNEE